MAALISGPESQTPPLDKQTGGSETLSAKGSPAPGTDEGAEAADFPIVAVGASAGGLEAATRLIEALPAAPGFALVLVQHLDPAHKSLLAGLLASHTRMPVSEVTETTAIEPDHLYVIAPGTNLAVSGRSLEVSAPPQRHGARLPVDFLLGSLAAQNVRKIAAVILSGTGADGSGNLRAFKDAGGLVIAQDPAEAEYGGMPQSAIDTGSVDAVLPVAGIPAALDAFVTGRTSEQAASGMAAIIEVLRAGTPHDFRLYKPGTLERRVERRMALAKIAAGDMPAYLDMLRKDANERDLLAKDLLINVTSFFRDARTFELLAQSIIPELVKAHDDDQPLRVWSAGCSSGEEAYSLAILFLEAIAAAKRPIKLQMFASDTDPDAVAAAREGRYPEAIASDIAPERLKRYFSHDEHGFRVSAELRNTIVFTVQDVLADPPFSRIDMISCRNLLIYLTPPAQTKVIGLFHFALRQRGILLLGSAETIGSMSGRFEVVAKKERIYRQVGQGRLGLSDFDVAATSDKNALVRAAAGQARSRETAFADLARRVVLETHAPAAVLIDRTGKCLYSLGPTDKYLQVASGYPTHDLLAMATPALRAKLRSAIGQVGKDTPRVVIGHSRIGATTFSIDVQATAHDGEELLLVAFVDEPARAPKDVAKGPATNARARDLEHELAITRDELRIALEGLETSNQEQKAINEEALSVNEEYQSTNEELLTSKEELQSLNEELTALNSQLQETLERQRSTSDDLQNVLYSTEVATLFLDPALNIRFFTPATRALFNVIPGDVGRPLADLRSLSADDRLESDARAVLKGSAPIEREIEVPGGLWFLRKMLPYLTHDRKVEGVVITFTDVTDRKHAAKALQATKREAELANIAKSRFLAAASHDLRQPLQALTLVQALLARTVEGDKAPKLVERLGQTLDAMTGMLNTLLDINQIEAGVIQPHPVDFPINAMFGRLRDEFLYQAQSQQLDLRIRPCTAYIHSDPRLLEQMIRNLLANAMKYTKTGRVLLGCRAVDGQVSLEVWDTGIGIAETELNAIFDEFHQIDNAARERSKGLWLGLSIVQRLGALLDHDIGVRSQLGKGSVFSIRVPRAAGVPRQKALIPAVEQATRAAVRGKIIVVEDDPEVRDLLEALLTTAGHHVRKADAGAAAIALVAKGAIRPDLVLADYNLPGAMDGLAVIAGIRDVLNEPVPGIVLTGDVSQATQARIAASDCRQLSKPVKSGELLKAIAQILEGQVRSGPVDAAALPQAADAVIFVVDDSSDVRASICDVLEAEGHRVEAFADAEAFLTIYQAGGGDGCLLLDVKLPGMAGIELLARLRSLDDLIPTIMMTGSSDVGLAVDAMKAGACDFIEKPVGRAALLASVRRAITQSHDIGIDQALHVAAAGHVAELTPRQHQVMDLVLAGHPSKNIAADLGISQRTVENHRASVMHKMAAKSLPELARHALAAERKAP